MKTEDVVNKLRALKLRYINEAIGKDPAKLPYWLAEFSGYASIVYDHYADALRRYEKKEAEVTKEENEQRVEINSTAEKKEDKITVTEVEQRIDVRLGNYKAEKKRLEQIVKGATMHINTCQSLMKQWGDEAKGIR